jgi:hypothetical protein
VESYYKDLFGKEPGGLISLGEDFWLNKGILSNKTLHTERYGSECLTWI